MFTKVETASSNDGAIHDGGLYETIGPGWVVGDGTGLLIGIVRGALFELFLGSSNPRRFIFL